MWIIVYFTNAGVPETGLSPTIRIRDLSDDSLVVTDAAMPEVGDGCYKYDFAAFDSTKDYAIRCDGTATLDDADRYAFAGSEWNDQVTALSEIQDATYGLSALEVLAAAIPTTAMRGTDNAALVADWTAALATALGNYTAARAGYLDELAAANIPFDIDTLLSRITAAVALEATLTAMKGAGWTDETLKAIKEAISPSAFADAVLDEDMRDHQVIYSLGSLQVMVAKWELLNNQLLLYDLSGNLVYSFNLTQDGVPTEYYPDKRIPA